MNVVIIGCGIVGAAIAYELSQFPALKITVIDSQPPAQVSTGAALGVLMGVISQKVKGRAWRLRETSIQRYETWIPQLEAVTRRTIPFNRQGIVALLEKEANIESWENLAQVRHCQGWKLEIWDQAQLQAYCPQVNESEIIGAVYSPQDRQLNPTSLTLALVDAAKDRGANFQFGVTVTNIEPGGDSSTVITTEGSITSNWVVVSAGLGSKTLTAELKQMIDIRPVLGRALQVRVEKPLGNAEFQPVITGNDVHIVPVGNGNYWVGATVEFAANIFDILPSAELLDQVWRQAIGFCPELATGTIIRTWSGLRPRPENRPAPVIEQLPGCNNILLATGHYRNGVLLAPATADAIREMIIPNETSNCHKK